MIYFVVLLLLFSCTAQHSQEDQPLVYLSRAMGEFQVEEFDQSAHDFINALDAIDYYQQTSSPEKIGQILLQDDMAAYVPPPFEETLARFYQALAFLHLGDEDNAAATLYYLENHEKENPLASYLLAILFERRGDTSNSRVLCRRLGLELSQGNVLILHHRGIAPRKISHIAPTSIVDAALLETVLKACRVKPALSTLTGVPIPVLKGQAAPSSPIMLNGQPLTATLNYDVAKAARTTLAKEMPLIATRSAARLLLRRGAVASVKKEHQPLVDVAMLISNILTKADTRSWTTLPSSIDLYHLNLPQGDYDIQAVDKTVSFHVDAHKLTLVEIFQPLTQEQPS